MIHTRSVTRRPYDRTTEKRVMTRTAKYRLATLVICALLQTVLFMTVAYHALSPRM